MKQRIYWSPDQVQQLAERVCATLGEDKGVRLRDFVAACSLAQDELMEVSQRRNLTGLTSVQKILDRTPYHLVDLRETKGRREKAVKAATLEDAPPTPFDVLIEGVVEKKVKVVLGRLITKFGGELMGILQEALEEIKEEVVAEVKAAPTPAPVGHSTVVKATLPEIKLPETATKGGRTPTIVVMGFHPSQVMALNRDFHDRVHLKGWLNSDGLPTLHRMVGSADAVLSMSSSKKVGIDAARSAQRLAGQHYHAINGGGVQEAVKVLESLLQH